jgi:uncharacterized protein YjbI with pentapeptide repeats
MLNYLLLKKVEGLKLNILKTIGVLFFLIFFSMIEADRSSAAYTIDNLRLTEQEIWVLNQVRKGKSADLKKQFGITLDKRLLSYRFLEKLLTGEFKNFRIPRQGIQISEAIIMGPLNLEHAEIANILSLKNCTFPQRVNFQNVQFLKNFSINGSVFFCSADFTGLRSKGSVFCQSTVFIAESIWSDVYISEKIHAECSIFLSNKAKANFNVMKVGTSAFFKNAIFCGPVDFVHNNIGRRFDAAGAEFLSDTAKVDFNSIKVGKTAVFEKAKFHGPVEFILADIGQQFRAHEAKFLSKGKKVDFSGMKVGNSAFFNKAEFHGPVDFEFAQIGAHFRAPGAQFLCEKGENRANFSRLRVAHKFFFDESPTIRCKVDMSYADLYDLEISDIKDEKCEGKEINIPYLNLKGVTIRRNLLFNNCKIAKLDLNGLTYKNISVNKINDKDYELGDFQKIKELVESASFSTQQFIELEAFMKRIGHEAWADEVFISMRDKELNQKEWWRRWLIKFFWGWPAGYGRDPWRVFILSLASIFIGAILFNPNYLNNDDKMVEGTIWKSFFTRLFISIDQFLPAVNLGIANNWNAEESHFLIWLYFNVEKILGWFMIPIALASIYTQIK